MSLVDAGAERRCSSSVGGVRSERCCCPRARVRGGVCGGVPGETLLRIRQVSLRFGISNSLVLCVVVLVFVEQPVSKERGRSCAYISDPG